MKLNSFGYSTKSKETSPIGGDIISRTMANPFMVSEAHGKSSLLFKCDMLICDKNFRIRLFHYKNFRIRSFHYKNLRICSSQIYRPKL